MNIQIKQIKGDLVELLFNPKEVDLRVGENLSLRENGNDRGLIVQVIEFRTISYPSLLSEMMDLMAEDPGAAVVNLPNPMTAQGLSEMSNLKLAIAKIRKVVQWAETIPQTQMVTNPA